MYCIGITGTIASGKSMAVDFFKSQGMDTFNADDIAKSLTQKNTKALAQISAHFGPDILTTTGELNRRQLRAHIMQNNDARLWLEALLHPMIREAIEASIRASQTPYCVIEIPLLTDRKLYPYLNRVLLITSEPEQQIKRLMARDQCSKTEARILLSHQEANNPREALADDKVNNVGTFDALNQQLMRYHQQYLSHRTVNK